uniref:Uncharacterized protein n=1 Tax=Steinernema glaseri TaxID=37863 RepID=A0A1I7ZHC3_9BILA
MERYQAAVHPRVDCPGRPTEKATKAATPGMSRINFYNGLWILFHVCDRCVCDTDVAFLKKDRMTQFYA